MRPSSSWEIRHSPAASRVSPNGTVNSLVRASSVYIPRSSSVATTRTVASTVASVASAGTSVRSSSGSSSSTSTRAYRSQPAHASSVTYSCATANDELDVGPSCATLRKPCTTWSGLAPAAGPEAMYPISLTFSSSVSPSRTGPFVGMRAHATVTASTVRRVTTAAGSEAARWRRRCAGPGVRGVVIGRPPGRRPGRAGRGRGRCPRRRRPPPRARGWPSAWGRSAGSRPAAARWAGP